MIPLCYYIIYFYACANDHIMTATTMIRASIQQQCRQQKQGLNKPPSRTTTVPIDTRFRNRVSCLENHDQDRTKTAAFRKKSDHCWHGWVCWGPVGWPPKKNAVIDQTFSYAIWGLFHQIQIWMNLVQRRVLMFDEFISQVSNIGH